MLRAGSPKPRATLWRSDRFEGVGPFDTSCFHCQQAAEKYLKGFLSFHDKPFPFTHNLHEIAKLCTEVSDETDWDREEITALTNYAVQLRYDNDFWPTKAEAMDALAVAERVRAEVLGLLPEEAKP